MSTALIRLRVNQFCLNISLLNMVFIIIRILQKNNNKERKTVNLVNEYMNNKLAFREIYFREKKNNLLISRYLPCVYACAAVKAAGYC